MKINIDYSSISSSCMRKLYYMKVLKIKKPESPHMVFGSAVHAGLAEYYRSYDVDKAIDEGLKLCQDDLKRSLCNIFLQYSKEYGKDLKPKKIEHRFEIPYISSGDVEVYFTGRIDLITEDGVLVEHKTTRMYGNSAFAESFDLSIQLMLYCVAMKLYLEPYYKAMVNVIHYSSSSPTVGFTRKTVEFSEKKLKAAEDMLFKTAVHAANLLGNNMEFEQNFSRCFQYNSLCPYFELCCNENKENESILLSEYIREEESE